MSNADDDVQRVTEFARDALSSESWCHLLSDNPNADERVTFEGLGLVTRKVRGGKTRTWSQLFDEFAAAWQFPSYEGSNYGAYFHDSLGALHLTWPTTSGFALIVTEPEEVLIDEPAAPSDYTGIDLDDLVEEFADTAEWYAEDEQRQPDDPLFRGPLSFDVVLVTDSRHRDEVVRRWRAAGAPLAD